MPLVRTVREGEQVALTIGGREAGTVIVKRARNGAATLVLALPIYTIASHEAARPIDREPHHATPKQHNP